MVLTPQQKELQRKRKIAEAEAKRMADIGTKKRERIDALELASARARRAGIPETSPEFPISERNKITTGEQKATEMALDIQRAGEERRAGFQEATGSQVLKEELAGKIAEPPSMEPEPVGERVKEKLLLSEEELAAHAEFRGRLLSGDVSPGEMVSKIKDFFTKPVLAGMGAGALIAAPYLLPAVATKVVTGSVLGKLGSIPFLKTAIAGVAIYTVGAGIFDYRGDEMDVLRQGLKKVVEDGERIEAASRNGLPTGDTISILTTMADEVSSAEIRIKELGNNNLQYRVSKEYILDAQNVRSSREALLRRVLAVENMAATGQAALNPEALMYDIAQFKEGK